MQNKNLKTKKAAKVKVDEQMISDLSEEQIRKYLKERFPLCDELNKAAKTLVNTLEEEIFSSEDNGKFDFMQLDKFDRRRLERKSEFCVDKNGMIILFGAIKMQRKVIAVMKLEGSKADIAKQTKDMINKAATSTYVTIDPPKIVEALDFSEVYGDSDTGGGEAAFTNLNNIMQYIMFQFQNHANLHPDMAKDIIGSGGFTWKVITPRQKQPWNVKNTTIEGVIAITAEGGPLRSAHDWWISHDGKTFSRLCPTIPASTLVKGLTQGLEVYFMHQLITKDGPQGFDLVIKKTVSTL